MPPSSSLTTSNISGPPRARRTRTRSKFNLRFNFVLNIFRRDRGGSSSAGSVGATDTTTTTTIFQDSTTATTVQKLKTETIIILTSGDERDDEDDFGRGRDGIFSPDELERRENIHIGEEKMAIATYPSMSLLNAVIPQENWDDDFEFHPSEGDNVNNAHDGRYDGRNERDALNAVEESMRVDLGHSTSATSGSLVPDSHRRSLAQQPPHPHRASSFSTFQGTNELTPCPALASVPTLDSSPQLENWDEDFADDHPAVQPTTPGLPPSSALFLPRN
ncbi:hypothetical protein SISSUDRAFT_400780 [Sistotremastrum suecicum HHB10207 ss-3]|uniref:Uncharacterized protein n=1 Tax=Sistotremastrum suecicum HHB10207 ss-3 TaxID=1314776 RepID=A0A166FSJ6_9AGAM|nr:hypothetical protein SISSUDRAFT_400780 [Sistotremastrum suecicum HHB10207 ss-3]